MEQRSQAESEQPAKVYQLDAVMNKVLEVNGKLDMLLTQTSGLVTTAQLSASEQTTHEKIKEEIDKIHLEYGPLKRNINWLFRTIVGEAAVIIGEVVVMYLALKK